MACGILHQLIRQPIYLITGAPGSGKSTVCKALLQRHPLGLHIPVDDVRSMVVSGIAHPVPRWTPETGRQFALARRGAAQLARLYALANFAVAIDDVIPPGHDVDDIFVPELVGLALRCVLLLPSLEVALARNQQRINKDFDTSVLTYVITRLHDEFASHDWDHNRWQVIDSSALTVEETVDKILDGYATCVLDGKVRPGQMPAGA